MKFYLCQTNAGLQLATTQAEAKKLDPKFKGVEFGADPLLGFKTSLAADINKLLKGIAGEPVAANEAVGEAVGEAFITPEEVNAVNAQRPAFLGKLSGAEIERHRVALGNCPKCGTNPASRLSAEVAEIEKFVETAPLDYVEVVALATKHRLEGTVKPRRRKTA